MRLLFAVAIATTALAPSLIADPAAYPGTPILGSFCSHFGGETFPAGPLSRLAKVHLGFWPTTLPAVRLPGFGTGGFPITTASAEAQAWFDYGVQLGHAFNHHGAVEAFRQAQAKDPNCAMCVWGEAWAMGPTINFDISAEDVATARGLAAKASALGANTSPKERALLDAMLARYAGDDHTQNAKDFATAMDAVAKANPQDSEIAILTADAFMITSSYEENRAALEHAKELLLPALARNPNDTGAIHFFIHVSEWLGTPAEALPYARRLGALAPAAGHLVHMPSHTYFRVGLYADGAAANVAAVTADESYAATRGLTSADDVDYHLHNVHFGTISGIVSGDTKSALALGDKLLALPPSPSPWYQIASSAAYFAYGRLGEAGAAMALPDPGAGRPVMQAMWHYMRGEVRARAHDAAGVEAEAAAIQATIAAPPASIAGSEWAMGFVRIAKLVLDGRAAMIEERYADAAKAFSAAADIEDTSVVAISHDPPVFWYPVRRSYALALWKSGKTQDALAQVERILTGAATDHADAWPNEPLTLFLASRIEHDSDPASAQKHGAQAAAGYRSDLTAIDPSLL